jgi:AcrR family transcriptional regulator
LTVQTDSSSNGRSGSFIEAARRAQIIDAAVATVNAVGYPGASLSRIAAQAGISKSVISYHFDGKAELLLHLVDEVFTALGNEVEVAVRAETDPRAKLAAYVRSYLGHAARNRAAVLAAMEIVVTHRDANGVPMYLTEGDDDTALLESVISAGMASGEFRTFDLTIAVTMVMHVIDAALTRSQMHPDTDLLAWAKELEIIVLDALSPHEE